MRASTISVRNSARPALRVSSLLEGLSHALDLTEGHPRGHATRTAVIGLRLGRALQLAPGLQAELLYALLLKDAGCSANASLVCDLFGGCEIVNHVSHLSLAKGKLCLASQSTKILADRTNHTFENDTRPLPVANLKIRFADLR